MKEVSLTLPLKFASAAVVVALSTSSAHAQAGWSTKPVPPPPPQSSYPAPLPPPRARAEASNLRPLMKQLPRFSGADVPALGPEEEVTAPLEAKESPPSGLPNKGASQRPMLYIVWVMQDWANFGPATAVQVLDETGYPERPGDSTH